MKINILIAFLLSVWSLLDLFLANKPFKIAFYSFSSILIFIPLLSDLYDFFTSPKSKRKRILRAFSEFFYSDYCKTKILENSYKNKGIYCNSFYNESVTCYHSRPFVFTENSLEAVDFANINGVLSELTVSFKKENEENTEFFDMLKNKGFIRFNYPKRGVSFSNLKMEDIFTLIMYSEKEPEFYYDCKVEETCITLRYNPWQEIVSYSRKNVGCSSEIRTVYRGVKASNVVYTMKAIQHIKISKRTCCFVTDGKVKRFSRGCRLHCYSIEDFLEKSLRGSKIAYGEYFGSENKCVENKSDKILEEVIFEKFGEKSIVFLKYIENFYSEKSSELKRFLAFKESAHSKRVLTNWQWKRFCVDISYLRECCGLTSLYKIDYKNVNPSRKCQSFLKTFDKNFLIKENKREIPHYFKISMNKEKVDRFVNCPREEKKEVYQELKEELKNGKLLNNLLNSECFNKKKEVRMKILEEKKRKRSVLKESERPYSNWIDEEMSELKEKTFDSRKITYCLVFKTNLTQNSFKDGKRSFNLPQEIKFPEKILKPVEHYIENCNYFKKLEIVGGKKEKRPKAERIDHQIKKIFDQKGSKIKLKNYYSVLIDDEEKLKKLVTNFEEDKEKIIKIRENERRQFEKVLKFEKKREKSIEKAKKLAEEKKALDEQLKKSAEDYERTFNFHLKETSKNLKEIFCKALGKVKAIGSFCEEREKIREKSLIDSFKKGFENAKSIKNELLEKEMKVKNDERIERLEYGGLPISKIEKLKKKEEKLKSKKEKKVYVSEEEASTNTLKKWIEDLKRRRTNFDSEKN